MLLLIHTIPALVDVFTQYCNVILPDVETLHVLDQPLLKRVQQQEKIEAKDIKRIMGHIDLAQEVGAKVGLITCSTLSPSVKILNQKIDFPIYPIDEAMLKQAVHSGKIIGLLATAQSTLEPSKKALLEQANLADKDVAIQTIYIKKALDLLNSGFLEEHDEIVIRYIQQVTPEVDVVVLAQASMARVCEFEIIKNWQIPVLSSPKISLEYIKEIHFK